MFKKLTSVALAALMLVGTTAVAASAAEAENEAVAATDTESVVGADDSDSNVGAETDSSSTGSDSVVYFNVNSTDWSADTIKQGIFMYLYDFKDGEIITWGSKKGKMTDEGDGKYSFDLGAKGIELASDHEYGAIFAGGSTWGMQTCDIIIGSPCFGHTASCTGEKVENNV
ncbi:MAG: hypothetical protein IIZ36_00325, partial [Ruminococcus sp.]|nr:hypothetical protein [Ruminococcus sp.]